MTTTLDHVVVNALRGMDAAAETFAALGFTLTPLGRHSLGSINHLMVAPGAYLELVAVPETGKQRQEVLDSPFGLSGLVFKTDDADAAYQRLSAAGLSPTEPVAFSRPVEIDGEARDARFRTVRVAGELFPAGRVYFCQHLTPELVWREEWLEHPNGFAGFDRIEVAAPEPETAAGRYAAAAGRPADAAPDLWRVTVDDFHIDVVPGQRSRFTKLGLKFRRLDRLEQAATGLTGVTWRRISADAGRLDIASLELSLECRSIA
ncbi:VOC family protein [Hansschlegelia beijingensis]|uniref:VOC family protein n=1 Tax=Hansschlegelia beijingensis TaxID=1133344 RepID=UPI00387EF526